MHIVIVTLFPELFDSALPVSMLGRALKKRALCVHFVNLRHYGLGKHQSVDDRPYGGGPGMLLRVEPLVAATEAALDLLDVQTGQTGRQHQVILFSPGGGTLTQTRVKNMAEQKSMVLVCGHYEGVDDRFRQLCVTEELSIGDYVLSGGELPALVVLDALARLQPGVLGAEDSTAEESFEQDLLEYPHFTRPDTFRGLSVPEVLKSGNHQEIKDWRRTEQLSKTKRVRPDLLAMHKKARSDNKPQKG